MEGIDQSTKEIEFLSHSHGGKVIDLYHVKVKLRLLMIRVSRINE